MSQSRSQIDVKRRSAWDPYGRFKIKPAKRTMAKAGKFLGRVFHITIRLIRTEQQILKVEFYFRDNDGRDGDGGEDDEVPTARRLSSGLWYGAEARVFILFLCLICYIMAIYLTWVLFRH